MSDEETFLRRKGEEHRQYLGDAVYASFDGYMVWLRTGDGNRNEIALESGTLHALFEYVESLKRHYSKPPPAPEPENEEPIPF